MLSYAAQLLCQLFLAGCLDHEVAEVTSLRIHWSCLDSSVVLDFFLKILYFADYLRYPSCRLQPPFPPHSLGLCYLAGLAFALLLAFWPWSRLLGLVLQLPPKRLLIFQRFAGESNRRWDLVGPHQDQIGVAVKLDIVKSNANAHLCVVYAVMGHLQIALVGPKKDRAEFALIRVADARQD